MLVAAELVGEEGGHAVGDSVRVGFRPKFEDSVHALSEFRIGQADDDAGAHYRDARDRGLDFRRIDIGAAAQDHVGEAVAEIEIAVGIEAADVAERFPSVDAALGSAPI